MQITINDYQRILGLLEMASLRNKQPDVTEQLLSGLKQAKIISQVKISRNIITMNSSALLRDLDSGRETTVTITYPHDANPQSRKISLFTPIGVALLGCKEGDVTSWRIPTGLGRFKIEKIIYQPEAAGDYHL